MTLKPCIECGELATGPRCEDHALTPAKASRQARGYDAAWQRLSRQARRLQPWCLDCGTSEDLTTDHSPEAWRRRELGLVIRLTDVAVVCRSCNGKRGRARPLAGSTPSEVLSTPGEGNLRDSHRGETR